MSKRAKSAQKELRVCSVVWPLEEKVSLVDKIRVHTSVQPFSYKLVATAPSDFVRSKSNKKARTPRNIERWLSDIISKINLKFSSVDIFNFPKVFYSTSKGSFFIFHGQDKLKKF